MMRAPIISFCYNRFDHIDKSLASLLANPEAEETDLIIFSDGPRNSKDAADVQLVRDRLREVSGFRSIRIVERNINYGVNLNIVDGVTRVMEEYGCGIIVEDDIIVSDKFLRLMNCALEFYKDESRVFGVSGYSYPFDMSNEVPDVFLLRHPSGWGWATWHDRWSQYSHRLDLIEDFDASERSYFDYDGATSVFTDTLAGNIWDIYWNATITRVRGLFLVPKDQLSYTIGLDGSGQLSEVFENPYLERPMQRCDTWEFPEEIVEHPIAVEELKKYLMDECKNNTIKERGFSRLAKQLRRFLSFCCFK